MLLSLRKQQKGQFTSPRLTWTDRWRSLNVVEKVKGWRSRFSAAELDRQRSSMNRGMWLAEERLAQTWGPMGTVLPTGFPLDQNHLSSSSTSRLINPDLCLADRTSSFSWNSSPLPLSASSQASWALNHVRSCPNKDVFCIQDSVSAWTLIKVSWVLFASAWIILSGDTWPCSCPVSSSLSGWRPASSAFQTPEQRGIRLRKVLQ